jgi:C4-dicarboxylate-specific signal transduction histidine kinase
MERKRTNRFGSTATECLLASITIALVTFLCLQLKLNLATAAFLYQIIIIVLSLRGRILSSTVVTLIASGCLAYYLAPPIFSFRVDDPFNLYAIITFVLTSIVIITLASRAHSRTAQLLLTTANLETQIAEREQAEEALQQAQIEFARVTRIMTMGELIASIAHEVNQPLSCVVANGHACLRWLEGDSPNLEQARESARRIVHDGKRAGDVIVRIRAMATKTAATKERLDMNETVQEVIALAQDVLRRNRVTVRTELAANLSPVLGDRVELQQVVLNLVMNGTEAMSSVEEGLRELVIRTQNDEADHVRIAVQDSGTGLAPQSMERIFDPFYTTKRGGMGLGLSISRSIVQNHGGRLWAVANNDPGTIFQFTVQNYHIAASSSGAGT